MHYELLYLVSGKYTEEELGKIESKVKKLLAEVEAKITIQDNLGKKRLAYPIQKATQGYYLLIEFDMAGEGFKKLDDKLKLTNEVMRHQIVKKKQKTLEEIKKETAIKEKIEEKQKEAEEKAVKEEKEAKEPKVKLEDLDKKLDELLEGEDII